MEGLLLSRDKPALKADIEQVHKAETPLILPEYLDTSTGFRGGAQMDTVRVERLAHLGVIAAVIKDVGIIDMLDARVVPDRQEEITPGEAVAGMMLNGLGVTAK